MRTSRVIRFSKKCWSKWSYRPVKWKVWLFNLVIFYLHGESWGLLMLSSAPCKKKPQKTNILKWFGHLSIVLHDPTWHWVSGGVHLGKVSSSSHDWQTTIHAHVYNYVQFGVTKLTTLWEEEPTQLQTERSASWGIQTKNFATTMLRVLHDECKYYWNLNIYGHVHFFFY